MELDWLSMALVVYWFAMAWAGMVMLERWQRSVTGFLLGLVLGPVGLIIAWTLRDEWKIKDGLKR